MIAHRSELFLEPHIKGSVIDAGSDDIIIRHKILQTEAIEAVTDYENDSVSGLAFQNDSFEMDLLESFLEDCKSNDGQVSNITAVSNANTEIMTSKLVISPINLEVSNDQPPTEHFEAESTCSSAANSNIPIVSQDSSDANQIITAADNNNRTSKSVIAPINLEASSDQLPFEAESACSGAANNNIPIGSQDSSEVNADDNNQTSKSFISPINLETSKDQLPSEHFETDSICSNATNNNSPIGSQDSSDVNQTVTAAVISHNPLQFPIRSQNILQWCNDKNLCWLDVILHCIVHSICTRIVLNHSLSLNKTTNLLIQ